MNKIFKVKFSFANNTSVVTSELAKSRGKTSVAKVVVAGLVGALGVATNALADPNNEITQAAGYSASKAITLTDDASEKRKSGVVFNAVIPDSETETNLFYDANIDVTGKYTHNQSAIAVGGEKDNDKKKATLSLKEVSLNLTEDVKNIGRKAFDVSLLPSNVRNILKILGNPTDEQMSTFLAQMGIDVPDEKTKRYFAGVQATYGGALYADKLSVIFNPKPIDKDTFKLFQMRFWAPVATPFEVPKNASLIGLLAGTLGVGHSSEVSSGLVNKVVIEGDYNFEAKRDFTEDDFKTPEQRALYPEIYGLQAIQNNDFYSGNPFNFIDPNAKQPSGKAPQAIITVKGKYTANIKNAIGFGVTVSGKINDATMPTVNLADTDITLNSIKGSALRVGADWNKGKLPVSKVSLGDGSGAGTLNFAENAVVNLTTTDEKYRDAAVYVSHGESVLDASKAKSFTVKSNYSALRVGDAIIPNQEGTGKNITVKINNADFSLTEREVNRAMGESVVILVSPSANEKVLLDFTSNDKSSLVAHKKGLLLVAQAGEVKFNFTGNGADKSKIVGAIAQSYREQYDSYGYRTGVIDYSKLDGVIDNATWLLGDKDGSSISNYPLSISLLSSLTLKNGAVLDAALEDPKHGSNNYYLIRIGSTTLDDKNRLVITKKGALTNDNSIIDLANNGKVGDYLEIEGNYVGNNGTIKVNTLWNRHVDDADRTSPSSDRIVIIGKASGNTRVVPVSETGVDNLIDGEVVDSESGEVNSASNIVVIGDPTNSVGAFTGNARTKNLTAVQLTSAIYSADNTIRRFFWTTKAKDANGNLHTIVDETVPAYALNQQANAELGQLTLGTLIERRGEQNKQAWVRLLGKKYNQETDTRFSHKAHLEGIQVHYDFNKSVNDEYNAYSAVFFTYAQAKAKFADEYHAKNTFVIADKNTGTAKTSSIGLGVSHTVYANTGIYLDSVLHFAKLTNKFASVSNVYVPATQKGMSFAVSLEGGKSFVKNNWKIEPQAQLTYQFTKYNQFNDGVAVDGYKAHDARIRLGSRFTYDFDKNKSAYLVANLIHKLTPTTVVDTGKGVNGVVDYHVNRTYAELGLGGQVSLGKNLAVYSDVRLERDFGGLNYEAYRGNVGLKYSW